MRIGTGYDVHRLVEDRKLILCGVEIPYELGLLGHSDADVALHAIMDALLGAASLKDIGYHFPDTDPAYKGASSMELLRKVGDMLDEKMYVISNIDCTIICQRPKLRPYLDQMVANVAEALGIEESQVNIKATTEEGLGFTGTGEGISSQAVCLLESALDGPVRSIDPEEMQAGGGCAACPMRGKHPDQAEVDLLNKSEETSL
jgi:2-C-methyl-D-erythritol 2,4-cyclodiphosphate synthase